MDVPITLQQRLYLESIERWGFDPTWQHVALAQSLPRVVSDDALTGAASQVLARHDACRARVIRVPGAEPALRIAPVAGGDVLRIEEKPSLETGEPYTWFQARAGDRFDLQVGPPVRMHVLRTSEATHVLAVAHHAVLDGPALTTVIREFVDALAEPNGDLIVPQASSYRDHAIRQRAGMSDPANMRKVNWWRRHLDGAKPELGNEIDHHPTAHKDFISARLEPDITHALVEGTRTAGFGMFALAFSAVEAVSSHWFDCEKQLVEVSTNARRSPFTQTVGHFTDRLFHLQHQVDLLSPERVLTRWRTTVASLARFVPSVVLAHHVDVLRQRLASQRSPSAVMLNFVNAPVTDRDRLSGISRARFIPTPAAEPLPRFDGRILVWMFVFGANGALHCGLAYERDVVSADVASSLVSQTICALREATAWVSMGTVP